MFLLTIPISNREAFAIAHASFICPSERSVTSSYETFECSSTSRIRYMMMMILLCSCIRCRSICRYIMLEFQSYSIHPSVVVAFEQGGLCYSFHFNVILIHRTDKGFATASTISDYVSGPSAAMESLRFFIHGLSNFYRCWRRSKFIRRCL